VTSLALRTISLSLLSLVGMRSFSTYSILHPRKYLLFKDTGTGSGDVQRLVSWATYAH
jgi:hypothetical protein